MNFFERVYEVVKKIPKGKVASYGLIAALCGSPRAARQVGWALHQLDQNPRLMATIPWHRVINSRGFISTTCHTHTADMQKDLLEAEGVTVVRKVELRRLERVASLDGAVERNPVPPPKADGAREKMWWVDLEKFLWKA